MFEFEIKTGKITIDHNKCAKCNTKACVKACSLFGTNILRLERGKPVLVPSLEDTKRGACIEDLACELYCRSSGEKGLTIELPIPGLAEYRGKSTSS